MSTLVYETRLAARTLRRSPGYSAVAIATLALGVAANAAIFGLLDAVLLRPLPFEDPSRLVRVWGTSGPDLESLVNPLDLADWQDRSRLLDGMFGVSRGEITYRGGDRPERIAAHVVSPSWLTVLGVTPALGRGFAPEESSPGRGSVVLLEHGFWQSELAGDPAAVGRTLLLDGVEHTIVGVLPPRFPHPLGWDPPSVWLPLEVDLASGSRGGHFLFAIGRLGEGATLPRAQAELDAITADLARDFPRTNALVGARLEPLRDAVVGDTRRTLWVLGAAVVVLLLVAALDVGALTLARQLERGHEAAVRTALGASRPRIVRGLLLESGLLAVAGSLVGLVLAGFAAGPLLRLGVQRLPWAEQARFDLRIALLAAGLALGTGLFLGLPAALRAAKAPALPLARRSRLRGATRIDARGALVVSQVALSLVLLSVAALVTQSLRQLLAVDPGFGYREALTARVSLPYEEYDEAARAPFFARLVERLEESDAIDSVGLVNRLPLGGGYSCDSFILADRPAPRPGHEDCVEERVVTPGYFDALGLTLQRGRGFGELDRDGAPAVVVINAAMARRYFADADPLGVHFRWGDAESDGPWREIVGVVEDVRHFGLAADPAPEVYLPHSQVTYPSSFHVVLRAGPATALAELRTAVSELDPRLPISDVLTMRQRIAGSLETERLRSGLLLLFAGGALALTLLGLWGVIAFSTARRRREIGLRLALGARRSAVLGLVARQGLVLVCSGVVLGLLASLAARQLVRGFLYGVGAEDPPSLLAACLVLLAGAAVAVVGPSLRALRIEPAVALRDE